IQQLGKMIATMHVAVVRPLAEYSMDALEFGRGWECVNCLGMGSERFRVRHAPDCPFALIPPEPPRMDLPHQPDRPRAEFPATATSGRSPEAGCGAISERLVSDSNVNGRQLADRHREQRPPRP